MKPIMSWGTGSEKALMTGLFALGLNLRLSIRLHTLQISSRLCERFPETHSAFAVEGFAKGVAGADAAEGGGGVKLRIGCNYTERGF
jgi:hypothetical protein